MQVVSWNLLHAVWIEKKIPLKDLNYKTFFFSITLIYQMEQIKRANKLFSNDCIFLRNSLNIPVVSKKRSIFNGLSLESPDGDGETACQDAHIPHVLTQDIEGPSPPSSPPPEDSKPPQPQPEELSAKDFLHRLDLQIKRSKQAAQRLKDEEVRWVAPTLPSWDSFFLDVCCHSFRPHCRSSWFDFNVVSWIISSLNVQIRQSCWTSHQNVSDLRCLRLSVASWRTACN